MRTPDLVPGLPKNPTRDSERETRAKSGAVVQVVKNGLDVASIPDDLSWDNQVEAIRRYNSKILGIVGSDIDAGKLTPTALRQSLALLKDCSTIAKQWSKTAEGDDPDMTPEERAEMARRGA